MTNRYPWPAAISMLWLVKNCPEVFLTPQSPSTVRCYRWTVMAKETRNKLKIIIFTPANFLNVDLTATFENLEQPIATSGNLWQLLKLLVFSGNLL